MKFQEIMRQDNLTRVVKMREEAFKYKEATEKSYIKKMFESRQMSPKAYLSKRTEIEKWVNKEKEDIKRSKRQIEEQYTRTQQMIEDANKNAQRIKKMINYSAHDHEQHPEPRIENTMKMVWHPL